MVSAFFALTIFIIQAIYSIIPTAHKQMKTAFVIFKKKEIMDNKRFTKFLFPTEDVSIVNSSLLLAARFIFGLTFLSHGLSKWVAFESLALSFPDPLGVGSTISLLLILFAEVICSIAFIVGFMYRLLMIPMIFAMLMAVFVIHSGDPLATRELAIIYLTIFVIMYITGPGNFSVDAAIYRHSISHKREREILVE